MSLASYPNVITNSIHWFRDPYAFLDQAQAAHGETFHLNLPGLGRSLLTGDPQLIHEIIANKHLVGGKGIQIIRALFGGESLITLHGEAHQKHRRILSPSFRRPDIACHDELTVQATLDVLRDLPCDRPFSAFELTRSITQAVIIRHVFGKLPAVQEAAAARLIHAFMTSFHHPLVLFLKPLRVDLGAGSPWGRVNRNRRQLEMFILNQIRTFRPTRENGQAVLAHLLRAEDLSEAEMVAELFALLMFGHDTSAATLSWVFAHIYSQPQTLAHIRDEGVCGAALEAQTSYLQASIHESMRLRPIVVQLFRMAGQDVDLAGHRIKKNQMVIPCTYLAHHNPAVFPEPQRFIPERFMDGQTYPNSFFPYGFGARLCLGKPLAQRQMPLILSTVIQNANLSLAPGYSPTPVRYMLFMSPRDGTLMVKK